MTYLVHEKLGTSTGKTLVIEADVSQSRTIGVSVGLAQLVLSPVAVRGLVEAVEDDSPVVTAEGRDAGGSRWAQLRVAPGGHGQVVVRFTDNALDADEELEAHRVDRGLFVRTLKKWLDLMVECAGGVVARPFCVTYELPAERHRVVKMSACGQDAPEDIVVEVTGERFALKLAVARMLLAALRQEAPVPQTVRGMELVHLGPARMRVSPSGFNDEVMLRLDGTDGTPNEELDAMDYVQCGQLVTALAACVEHLAAVVDGRPVAATA